jgi:small-conductance mechanosensitive channel
MNHITDQPTQRLQALKNELNRITNAVGSGDLSNKEAADQILQVREEIDELIQAIEKTAKEQGIDSKQKPPTGSIL